MTKLSSIHSFPSPYWALLDEMAKGTEIHLTFSSQKEAEALRFTLYRFHGLLKKASEHSHPPHPQAPRPLPPSHYNELRRPATERQRNAYRLTAWRHRFALHLAAKAQAAPTPLP